MSFVITMYIREGIVMASDSRLTLNTEQHPNQATVVQVAVGQSDSNYKIFLAPNNIGISTFGAAEIKGVPIGGYIEYFISEQLQGSNVDVQDVAQRLLAFVTAFEPTPDTQFHVAGYKTTDTGEKDQQVWHVWVAHNTVDRSNPPGQQGGTWVAKRTFSRVSYNRLA